MFKKLYHFSLIVCLFSLTTQALAGAWTLKRGNLWVKSSFFYQKTDERFYSRNQPCPLRNCEKGQRVPFPFNGESRVTAIYFDINYGLLDWLELDVQIPYFDIAFTDDSNPFRDNTTSVGDIRFGARFRWLTNPVVSTLKIQAKAPTGLFNKDSEFVPIGDGQWDLEIQGQFGRSLWPLPFYVNLDIGYRFRFEPNVETTDLDPGDEFTLRAEAGYNITQHLLLKAAIDGFWGDEFTNITTQLRFRDSGRNILYFEPGIYWQIYPPLAVEASTKISLSGKNYPAGVIYSGGVSYTFSIFK